MKTKLYRTITLVLAIVMLLGVTPAFAAGVYLTPPNADYWENHRYLSVPYDYNIAKDPNSYIPFSSLWEYGDRTSASSKSINGELADGVFYHDPEIWNSKSRTGGLAHLNLVMPENTEFGFLDGNTHVKTTIITSTCASAFSYIGASNLKLAIILDGFGFGDWIHSPRMHYGIFPTFPRGVTVIGGLTKGEMYIANSENYQTRTVFKNRYDFIEAVKPILASAHMTDRAWDMIPKEFGGNTSSDVLAKCKVSDWAKDEVIKAQNVGIITSRRNFVEDYRTETCKEFAVKILANTYEAVCKANGQPTNYPSYIPEVFGPNKTYSEVNKAAYLGIINENSYGTWEYNHRTYKYLPYQKLVREQMAAMLTRLAKACGKTLPSKALPFTDPISKWAVPEVEACYGAGLIKGTSKTTFAALDNMTGEQAIVLCWRAYVYLTTH